MEAVEIAIYLFVALAVGGMIIYFIATLNISGVSEGIRSMLGLSHQQKASESISEGEIAASVYQFWKDCGFGSVNSSKVFSVSGNNATYSFPQMFSAYRRLRICSSIQSKSNGCGSSESIVLLNKDGSVVPESSYNDSSKAYWDVPGLIAARCNSTDSRLYLVLDR